MAKTRRTKKEKIRASMRESVSHTQVVSSSTNTPSSSKISYSLPTTAKTASNSSSSLSYTEIVHDLRKTLFVTGAIVIAQVILFVLLQNR